MAQASVSAAFCPCGAQFSIGHELGHNSPWYPHEVYNLGELGWKYYEAYKAFRAQRMRTSKNATAKLLPSNAIKMAEVALRSTTHPCAQCGSSVPGRGQRLCTSCRAKQYRARPSKPLYYCIVCGEQTFDAGACTKCRNKAARFRKRVGKLNEERTFVNRVEHASKQYPHAGIYVIWSSDKTRAYVGEAQDISIRWHDGHKTAILLGCIPEIITELPNSAREDRLRAEQDTIRELREQGVSVVNEAATT